jgi:phenylalanine-4-hydroxylase
VTSRLCGIRFTSLPVRTEIYADVGWIKTTLYFLPVIYTSSSHYYLIIPFCRGERENSLYVVEQDAFEDVWGSISFLIEPHFICNLYIYIQRIGVRIGCYGLGRDTQ